MTKDIKLILEKLEGMVKTKKAKTLKEDNITDVLSSAKKQIRAFFSNKGFTSHNCSISFKLGRNKPYFRVDISAMAILGKDLEKIIYQKETNESVVKKLLENNLDHKKIMRYSETFNVRTKYHMYGNSFVVVYFIPLENVGKMK